ncbi:MAG: hypothetical protein AB7T06_01875 [Kofleriaceae bacterium]
MNPRAILKSIAERPGLQIVIAGAVLAIAFPARSSGAIGLTIIAGALGIAVALGWPKLPEVVRKPPSDLATLIVITVVMAAGVSAFWDTLTIAPDWPLGDWGPQHAVLANIQPSLPGLDVPVWNHVLSTGDAPLELYPSLAYYVTGHFAALVGLEGDLAYALMIVAVIVHILLAVATAAITMQVAPKPIAVIIGLVALVDSGAIAHGGTVGLFKWALFHSAMSLAFASFAALAVIAAVRRPRLRLSIAIWILTALACIAHPAGLIAAASAMLALLAVALLASDVPPRRALAAIGHVGIGVLLGAAMWMPLAERILEYGQHFPNAIRAPARLLQDLLTAPSPVTHYALLVYAGFLGIVAGLWSRRAAPVFVATSALVLLLGMSDVGYLAFDLAPGQGVARLGTERLAQLARPFIAACGAYGIAAVIRGARATWLGANPRQRLVAAALLGILSGAVIRVFPTLWWDASARAQADARNYATDPAGRRLLTAWANTQMKSITPSTWARAVFETDTHEHMHLTAETGLPTFHDSWLPDLLLRERIEDLSDASLRRFNVRWVIAQNKAPQHGDPATERELGTYRIREVKDWDGKFARIEKGSGDVRVLRLDDRAVEIEVTGTTEPVLVALGTGFYPRWRAHHASGAPEPVYAMPTIPGGRLHVVAAWVAPGKTTFTVDGPLPSDGKGRVWTILAALFAIAATVGWSVRRLRIRALRTLARLRARAKPLTGRAVRIAVPLAILILVVRGCIESRGITKSIEVGSGLRATALVEARLPDTEWETCGYSRIEGVYYCTGLLSAKDGIASTLNDAAPSWGFNTPAIIVEPDTSGVEVRIRMRAHLAGTYWAATSADHATVTFDGDSRTITRSIETYADRGDGEITITAQLTSYNLWSFTFVREDTLLPPRDYLVAPPETAPDAVRAIR